MLTEVIPLNQALQVTKVEHNPGLLPVKLGMAYVQNDKWIIAKTIDLSGIDTDLQFNIQKYKEFNNILLTDKTNHINEFSGLRTHVEYLRDEAIEKLHQLIPQKRVKSGILNPLGSLIKVITGNLDNDDALHYDKLINSIQNSEQAVAHKVTIISEMLDHFMNTTMTIVNNSMTINKRLNHIEKILKDITTKENNALYSTYVLGLFHLFVTNFRTIIFKFSEIETALAFGKVSVLHKSVINSTELINVLKVISDNSRLMYPVNEQNLINLEETFSVKAYFKNDQVSFIIEVPLINEKTYNYFKLFPLPISSAILNQTVIVIPEYPYLLFDDTKYRPMSRSCKEITAEEFLCNEDDIIPLNEETCVEQLMKFSSNLSRCTQRTIETESIKIHKITPTYWMLFTSKEIVLSQTCDNDVTRQAVKGTYLINIELQCDVYLAEMKIYEHKFHSIGTNYKPIPIINLPDLHLNDVIIDDQEPVDLKGVNLDEIQHLNYLLKHSKSENSENSVLQVQSFSIADLILYLILTVLIVFAVYIWKKKLFGNNKMKIVKPRDLPQKVQMENLAPEESVVNQRPLLV